MTPRPPPLKTNLRNTRLDVLGELGEPFVVFSVEVHPECGCRATHLSVLVVAADAHPGECRQSLANGFSELIGFLFTDVLLGEREGGGGAVLLEEAVNGVELELLPVVEKPPFGPRHHRFGILFVVEVREIVLQVDEKAQKVIRTLWRSATRHLLHH